MAEPSSNPEGNLAAFIEAAIRSVALKGIDFAAWHWSYSADDPVAKKQRRHREYSRTITFSNRETSTREYARVAAGGRSPMSQPYLLFAKADIRLFAERANIGLDVLRRRLSAHQFLERTLRQRHSTTELTQITIEDVELAEAALVKELGAKTAYKVSNQLQSISELIDARRFAKRAIQYSTRLKRPDDGDELTEQGETAGIAKMISDNLLNYLAGISANPQNDDERFIIRIVDLLVCGGFRIGEVLTLPVDCLVEGSNEPRVCPRRGVKLSSIGIRYAVEKLGSYDVKWLPHTVVPLAQRAISELKILGGNARNVAKWMEAHPGRLMPFSLCNADHIMPIEDASALLFGDGSNSRIPNEIPRGGSRYSRTVCVGDIEAYYLKRYDASPVFTLRSGANQMLSDTLVVHFANQFHDDRKTLEFLPRLMTYNTFADLLSPTPSRQAAGVGNSLVKAKSSGSVAANRAKSHQFRHWLSTLASNEGLSDLDLAKWMGRTIEQNEAYKHRKMSTRVEWARQAIIDKKLIGEVSRIAESLPLEEREAYLKSRIQAFHSTPYGGCTHNYASSPCKLHMQCLSGVGGKGCGDLVRTKGNQLERKNLLELKDQLMAQISQFEGAVQSGNVGAANWLSHAKNTLSGTLYALNVDEDPRVPDGTRVNVFNSPTKSSTI